MQVGADELARIIERYQRAVYAVAFSGLRDRALADDVTQETFVVAWRRFGELRDEHRLGAWLCGIARNQARDLRKRRSRESLGEVDDVADSKTPFDALDEAERERLVADALGRVPEVYREALVLYYYEDRSIDDVARCLGISAATTNKRISRGRHYLAAGVETVERGLARRGPKAGLAAAVLAAIGVSAPSHVEASTAKGSTMLHKLALATVATTAALGGAAYLIIDARSTDAHPHPTPASGIAAAPTASRHATTPAMHATAAPSMFAMMHGGGAAPALPASPPASGAANDCAAVARHLVDLELDTRSDRASAEPCADCIARYQAHCERDRWVSERRDCILAAPDMINAHLCAGGVSLADGKPVGIPPQLACSAIAPKLAAVAQGAGLHPGVTDLGDQIAAACDVGNWSIELRSCLAAGTTMAALEVCMIPPQ